MDDLVGRMTEYVANNYIPVPESGCWIWLGCWNNTGYGKLGKWGREYILAHRLFYAFHKGPIPEGLLVCHKCDTPICVNPDHLFLGTHKDNCDDKIAKGRHKIRLHKICKPITHSTGASRYRGVTKHGNNFRARVEVKGVLFQAGTYREEVEAAHAYNRVAVRLLGDKAILNPIGEK